MKDYPSIPRAMGQAFQEIPNAHVFDKLDGQSMRSEWNRKRGWYKHGMRHTLLDPSTPMVGAVPAMFDAALAEPLARINHDVRWQNVVVYYEFWGQKSLGGIHEAEDPKVLTVFDVLADGEMLEPVVFRTLFEAQVETARFLGRVNWTRGYIDLVRQGQVEGVTSEGVVAKLSTRRGFLRSKAKTQTWIDRILARHGETEGLKIIES
jgi:hypothetical protein